MPSRIEQVGCKFSQARIPLTTQKKSSLKGAAAESVSIGDRVLRSIRKILRQAAEQSRQVAREGELSVSSLMCLRAISESSKTNPLTGVEVASQIQLSTATVSRILDRLDAQGLIERVRSASDRRKVGVFLTAAGKRRIAKLPAPLQVHFLQEFQKLPLKQQQVLAQSLEKIVSLMGATEWDAAPLLTSEPEVSAKN